MIVGKFSGYREKLPRRGRVSLPPVQMKRLLAPVLTRSREVLRSTQRYCMCLTYSLRVASLDRSMEWGTGLVCSEQL